MKGRSSALITLNAEGNSRKAAEACIVESDKEYRDLGQSSPYGAGKLGVGR
jgi:hypothetical protein